MSSEQTDLYAVIVVPVLAIIMYIVCSSSTMNVWKHLACYLCNSANYTYVHMQYHTFSPVLFITVIICT